MGTKTVFTLKKLLPKPRKKRRKSWRSRGYRMKSIGKIRQYRKRPSILRHSALYNGSYTHFSVFWRHFAKKPSAAARVRGKEGLRKIKLNDYNF